jgi:hypothetical protein
MDWLNAQPGCFAKVIQIGKIPGRRNVSKGVSDIVGAWKGKALAIEVKRPGEDVTEEQVSFLSCWKIRGGGISIVARCLEDVIQVLKAVDEREKK